jgi:hypothetical protein
MVAAVAVMAVEEAVKEFVHGQELGMIHVGVDTSAPRTWRLSNSPGVPQQYYCLRMIQAKRAKRATVSKSPSKATDVVQRGKIY